MIPKRIELENFLSFGKPAVAFTFTDDEPLWALCGRNGVGKSAVFDGITYALYGEHRGGTQKAEQLIRHGANGFRIVLEFEFAGIEYRVTRIRAGRTAQKAERRVDGEWEAVPGVNSAADLKAWVERTLGLGYKAFTTSVLLRQGEADKLFSASRDERIAVLKGIIGFERFEEVSGRVHAATLSRGSTLDALRRQLRDLVPVAPEELAGAEAAVTSAEGARAEAQAALTAAAQRVEQAKQWSGLEIRRGGLEQQLAAAEQRAADAATIRAAKARLDDLAVAVPELAALVTLRGTIAAREPNLAAAEAARDKAAGDSEARVKAAGQARQKEAHHQEQARECERQAQALREAIDRGAKFLQLADAMEGVRGKLAAFPADLAEHVTRAEADEKAAGEAKQTASGDLAAAAALLGQAHERRDRFADVAVGVTCSQCGQLVDEAHAAKERARLAHELETREGEVAQLRAAVAVSEAAEAAARKCRLSLQQDKASFDKLTAELAATSANLTQLGGVADAAALRTHLAEQRQAVARAAVQAAEEQGKQTEAKADADRLDRERKAFDLQHKTALETVRALEIDLAAARAASNAGWTRLSADWQVCFPHLDAEGVQALGTERDRLQASGVAVRFDLLRQDDEKRAEWSEQLQAVRGEIDRIPADARIPATEVERRQGEAKTLWEAANGSRDTAVRTRDGLQSRAEQYQGLTAQLRVTEREHDLHKKLDDLLGQNGLQRELVRDAEQQIVGLANDTLQHLSDGDLSLEQDDEAAGRDDKAFALRVRRAGDPLPIGVLFLSGSQKFRVAVSVALAVGRFASGRARPLEAVIIDEGFGSLDKDGLRAMADELKRLQRSQSLKRVILVSHQDEFTDQFPVGYRLSPAEGGTAAAPFRR
jgi:DNA repair exonuclease SbcCD ATPase subunit